MYIYFMQGQITHLVKIGRTGDPKNRLASIRTNSPDKIKLLKLIKADKGDEDVIHKQFASVHSHGEWFYPSLGLMEYIDGLEGARMPYKTKAQKQRAQRKSQRKKEKKRQRELEIKKQQHPAFQRAKKAQQMYKDGLRPMQIARALSVHPTTINKDLKKDLTL